MFKKTVFTAFLCVITLACGAEERKPFDAQTNNDLRGIVLKYNNIDLREYDLRGCDLTKTWFDTFTKWPEPQFMPKDFDPNKVLEIGKDPGLGVRDLHKKGVTGRGVNVAIIDQPLLLNHVEYKDRIKKYTEIETDNAKPQMHGSGVSSILCGKTCGVAPEANLYYWAEASWKRDFQYKTRALDEIVAFNEGKELKDRIRVVSISKGFDPSEPNLDKWKEKIHEAESKGIYIIHCSSKIFGIEAPLNRDRNNPESYQLCSFFDRSVFPESDNLFAPIDNRTYANFLGKEAYSFCHQGGLSWATPYIAGVIALGLQVNPDLTTDEITTLLFKTGHSFQKGKIIQPVQFVEELQKQNSK